MFLFCMENKIFRDKKRTDKENYYAVFALKDDFVLFCCVYNKRVFRTKEREQEPTRARCFPHKQ